VASSSDDAELMELLQLQNEQGPCMDCYHTASPVSVPDLAATDHWPRFAAAVAKAGGFRSVHALPLRLRGDAIGALNLFHQAPGPMPEPDLALGQALADVATIGILQERAVRRSEIVTEQLQTALTSRIVIEQAKGVLAQHHGLTMDSAFDRLRRYTRARNLRLAEVARQLAASELNPAAISAPSTAGSRRH
jgi:GAF domain-containing protein